MTNRGGRFKDQVAIVTGGASGIGLAIATRLIHEGAQVVAADLNQEQLKGLENKYGERYLGLAIDVTKEAQIEKLVNTTADRFGRLDIGFNVAGASKPGPITDLSEADWDFTVDLCLKGVFLCMKHQARQMKRQGGGSIINIASLNAHVPMYAGAAYSSAKAGVEMLTKNGALELTHDKIRVNAILPGLVKSPLTSSLLENKDIKAAYMERIPMGRAAIPEDMAGPALFLASDDATYITGASLLVDGGWSTTGYPDMSRFL